MSDKKMTEEEQELIDGVVNTLRQGINAMPPDLREMLIKITSLAEDEVFIENLRKEIINRYGE